MVKFGWLTPDDIPADTICRSLFIPNSEAWIAIVTGCLLELSQPFNWEAYGTLTPDECAVRCSQLLDEFTFQSGNCRVIGEIIAYAGSGSPLSAQWLLCDGSSLLRTDYPDLFTSISTTYGSTDTDHFNIPDLRGYTLIGQNTTYPLGVPVGEVSHVLVTSEIPAHTHTDTGHTHIESTAVASIGAAITGVPVPSAIPGIGSTGSGFSVLSNTGGDGSHNNMQPSMPITYLIYAKDR